MNENISKNIKNNVQQYTSPMDIGRNVAKGIELYVIEQRTSSLGSEWNSLDPSVKRVIRTDWAHIIANELMKVHTNHEDHAIIRFIVALMEWIPITVIEEIIENKIENNLERERLLDRTHHNIVAYARELYLRMKGLHAIQKL
jgi:hypothetical protein